MNTIVLASLITLLLLVSVTLWLLYKKLRGSTLPSGVIVLLAIFCSMNAAVSYFVYPKEDFNAYKRLTWQPLAPSQINSLVAEGKTVFVDVTADWCSICKRNKDSVINREIIVDLLDNSHIVLMRGDLSSPNALVEQFLEHNGQSGIPYNRVYGPKVPQGVVLPGKLTIDDVEQALSYVQ
ncbi:thioredoxin family protein [Shewanella waksmanii]|uniref:thioredoxin family protein n=1 Tax=Shewanella waksmanii TaxID=213783 RepID=UPI00373527DE